VTVENVVSYRYRKAVPVSVPGYGLVQGDVAWGGNWFYLLDTAPCELVVANQVALTAYTWAIRGALAASQITGEGGAEIDHIEVSGPAYAAGDDSRNFVLCPGGAYDRSPCGTGTSAKLACLAAEGKLAPGKVWRQEGILGTVFEASYRPEKDITERIVPSIRGSAFITGEGKLILDPQDPFCNGIRS
jgi:4-hydroxyproline epimerase